MKIPVNDYVKILEEEDGVSNSQTLPLKNIKKEEFDLKKELQKCINRKEPKKYEFTFQKRFNCFLKMIKNDFDKNKPYNFKKTKIKKYCLIQYKNYEITLGFFDRIKNLIKDIWEHTKFCWSYDNFLKFYLKTNKTV